MIKQLKEEVDKLKALLDDPQEGLFTWNVMVAQRMENITKLFSTQALRRILDERKEI